MLARRGIMQRLWDDLTKTTPSNLTVIGPRFAGKTVIMNALASRVVAGNSPYEFVLQWHLGHIAPVSDEDFLTQLCDQLRDVLRRKDDGYAGHREYLAEYQFSTLKEVTDALDSDGKPILMLWDGFDKPLGQGRLSAHLWDQMRTIFYGKKHKIVIAARSPLSELIRSQDAISSPFWNIFDMYPVRVGVFDDTDVDEILNSLSEMSFPKGARTELINWSAGYPPFFLEVLNQTVDLLPPGTVDNEVVNTAALRAIEHLSDIISSLWEDCPEGTKDIYRLLTERGELLFSDVGKDERACLIEKGFAKQAGNKLILSCRMLQEHIRGASPDAGTMARLFGNWKSYESNIRGLLERRLAHIPKFDERLYRLVSRALEDIPEFPDDCLNNMTSIEERALDVIWQREFGNSRTIPTEIIVYWTTSPRNENYLIKEMMAGNSWVVPSDRTRQIRLLQILTGSQQNFESKAKATSKDTYVLINAVHSYRNRNQHSAGQEMHVGVAVAAIMTCLELLACLDRECPV